MIENISNVLLATSAINADPTGGKPNLLYYDSILRELEGEQFHPAGTGQDVDDSIQLQALTDQEWKNLAPIGTLKVPQLVFARGTAKLLEGSRNTLKDLADTLRTQRYYVRIQGSATRKGNLELNKKLASERARAAADDLIHQGIGVERIQTTEPILSDVPSVTFTLGQLPY
jgi:outer membrane protein OmpA-like peptidoglycan-associated protein